MAKNRVEAFSDGVIAILITILVLEFHPPEGTSLAALAGLWPEFLAYLLSYAYLGIYWNNHHHMLHTVGRVTGPMLWANLHLLFWLSLVPFTTGWMGEHHFAPVPTAAYGFVLLMAAIAYFLLQQLIIGSQGPASLLQRAIGGDWKGKLSPPLYLLGVLAAGWASWLSLAIYFAMALVWLVPDRRIERMVAEIGD